MGKELYGLKILVVDDDVDTRELIEWVLKRVGAEVKSCRSNQNPDRQPPPSTLPRIKHKSLSVNIGSWDLGFSLFRRWPPSRLSASTFFNTPKIS